MCTIPVRVCLYVCIFEVHNFVVSVRKIEWVWVTEIALSVIQNGQSEAAWKFGTVRKYCVTLPRNLCFCFHVPLLPPSARLLRRCLQKLGDHHSHLVSCLVPELLNSHPFLMGKEPDVDDPACIPHPLLYSVTFDSRV